MHNTDAVPFGNSAYQIGMEIYKHKGDGRKYRHILLQINQKTRALKECEFRRRRLAIDLEEIEQKMAAVDKGSFEYRRLAIDKEEKTYGHDHEDKLIKDALLEVAIYNKHLERIPAITRNDFEALEHPYWRERLKDDARRELIQSGTVTAGTIAALESTGLTVGRNEKNEIAFVENKNNDILCELPTIDIRQDADNA